ncbi:MAG: CHAT domain-containing protein [Elainellaceae cyanobacterium]
MARFIHRFWQLSPVAFGFSLGIPAIALLIPQMAIAQSITPARDSTDTRVSQTDNRYDIDGGMRSSDGTNLFHDFEQFGLSVDEIANFLSDSDIQNILSRVSGGEASFIDGLIQVSGSDANLFLMNPAGIVFGANARLDVAADFTATTATGIGFENGWFNAVGDNNYANLVGTPSHFAFATPEPGSLVNAGTLAVATGQNLTLIGGTVVNTGTLSAPGGAITISAVSGESVVRISQEGHLLNLEIAALDGTETPLSFDPLDLPTLLTGSELANATGIEVNPDGTVQLTGSSLSAPSDIGTALISGTVDTRIEEGFIDSLPQIAVTGDRVALLNATLDASSTAGGGSIRIGGDYQGNDTLSSAQHTYVDAASTLVANGISPELTTSPSHGGRIIVWADDTTAFYGSMAATGGELGGDGGFAEVSGSNNLTFHGIAHLSASNGLAGTLLLDPENILIVDGAAAPDDLGLADNSILFNDFNGNLNPTFTISKGALEALGAGSEIILQATNNITISDLANGTLRLPNGGGTIRFNADADGINGGSFRMLNPSNVIQAPGWSIEISGAEVDVGLINTRNGDVNIGDLNIISTGDITTSSLDVYADFGSNINSGNIVLQSGGSIDTTRGILNANASSGNAGSITLIAEEDIITSRITAGIVADDGGIGGTIALISLNGSINSNNFSTLPDSLGDVAEPSLRARTVGSNAGSLVLKAPNGEIRVGSLVVDANNERLQSSGGSIEIDSPTIILNDLVDSSGSNNSGSIYFNGNVLVNESISIDAGLGSNGATVEFGAFVNGDRTLTINATDVDFQDTVNVSELDLNANNIIDFDGAVTSDRASITSDSISFQDTVNIDELDITADNQVSFAGAVTSDRTLTINATDVDFQDTVNAGLLTITSDITEVESDIITTDNITFNSQVVLNNPVTIEAQNSTIALNNGLDAGNNNLTLSAAEIDLQGSVTGNRSRLTLQPSDSDRPIRLGSRADSDTTLDFSQADLDTLSGFSRVIIGDADDRGGITVVNPIELNVATRLEPGESAIALNNPITTNGNNLTLGTTRLGNDAQIRTNGGILRFRGTVNGSDDLRVRAGTGNINFRQQVGDITPPEKLRIRNTGILRVQDGLQLRGRLNQRGARRVRIAGEVNISDGNLVWRSPLILIDDTSLISSNGNIRLNRLARRAANAELTEGLQLQATSGNIRTRNINLAGEDILLISDETEGVIRTGNLNSSADAGGGNITVQAGLSITTGDINSSAVDGDAGDVFLDPKDDIQVGFINAESDNGQGGDVVATTERFFRSTNTFTALDGSNVSISAIGGTQGGDITLTHDGGARLVFFNVGALDLSDNGVAGAIATGTPGNINVIEPIQGFLGPYDQFAAAGDIRIITTPQPLPETDDRTETPAHIAANGPLDEFNVDAQVFELEAYFTEQFEDHSNLPDTRIQSLSEIRNILQNIESETGVRPAIIYATFTPQNLEISRRSQPISVRYVTQESDILHLIMVFANGDEPIQALVPDLTRGEVVGAVDEFLTDRLLFDRDHTSPDRYLSEAQQFYQWLVAPLEPAIEAQGITNLVFVLDEGLRSVPLAALHNTEHYIIVDYSLGLMPSMSLTDTRYSDPRDADVLAMGISDFSFMASPRNLSPLPAVPLELQNIIQAGWDYELAQNEAVTIENLIAIRQQRPFGILHLATHAKFEPGQPDQSFIQFWQERLQLDQVRELGLDSAIVNLMVLSACQTALGNREAELGFAGFAAQASVRSVLATLWTVDDVGTMVVMDEFYRQLREGSPAIKAEALRQTQLALFLGELTINEEGQVFDTRTGQVRLDLHESPQQLRLGELDLSHPYIWSGFTMVGSPW